MNRRRSRVYAAPVPKMPPGLIQLMDGLAKDVLRSNPSNIYDFCAEHMQKLLRIRNEAQGRKSAALQQKIAKAQHIIRERAEQRHENYEKNLQAFLGDHNSSNVQTFNNHVRDVAEDASVSESESSQNLKTCPQETVANELIDDNNFNSQSGEADNCQFENLTSNEIEINDVNEHVSGVSESEFAKEEKVSSTDTEHTTTDSNEKTFSTNVNTSDVTNQENLIGQSSVSIDDVESDPRTPKEENTIASSRNADELKISDEQDHACLGVPIPQNQMDLETAAITIQKVFRTFLFKSKTTSLEDATNVDINLFIDENNLKNDTNKERRALNRMDTVLQTVNEEKSLSLSTDDSSTLSSAATVIQAHIRGFLVRNKLNVNKAPTSAESMIDSKECACTSFETKSDQLIAKTVLNIHLVPEKDNFASRDESLRTSMDLSMDDSSLLMPLQASYDISERRKQLKREDAIQSISPPSDAVSIKLSEDTDSVACGNRGDSSEHTSPKPDPADAGAQEIQTAVENVNNSPQQSLVQDQSAADDLTDGLKHSSEFHDVVLPTKVTRGDTSIVRGE